jgi:hypothetical protein
MRNKFKVQSLRFKVALRLCAFASICTVVSSQAATTNTVQVTNAPAATASTNANNGTDFPSFKIIADRNIFSANRSGRISRGPTRKPTKVDAFTLVGTIDYSKGLFAIFDGSSSSFRKTVKAGDSFAGFKIADVDLDHVTIATTNGNDTVLHVGSGMRRVDDGDWTVGSGPAPAITKSAEPKENADEPAAAAVADTNNNSESSDEPAPSAGGSDVLKKLMEKRKAEVKNEPE